jgi:hypothetical protein
MSSVGIIRILLSRGVWLMNSAIALGTMTKILAAAGGAKPPYAQAAFR